MMIKRWFIGFLLLLSLVGLSGAQDASQPLILVRAGDLWEWTGGPTLRQKTQWGYNSDLFLSPLNNEVVYISLPQVVVDYYNTQPGGGGDGALPTNLWVISTESSDLAYRIADQPADASYMTPNVPMKALSRSVPIWSPDGMQIAWAEQDLPHNTPYRLMVYDKTTQTTRTLVSEMPPQVGLGSYFNGVWTDKGIVMFSHALSSESGVQHSYLVYDAETGAEKFNIPADPILIDDDRLEPRQALPIQYQGKTWLAVLYIGQTASAGWQMIDLDEGQFTGETANIIGFAPGYAETSLRVIPVVPPNQPNVQYVIRQANGVIVPFSSDPNQQIFRFALSPDGEAIAYQLFDTQTLEVASTIYVWHDGVTTTVPQTEFPAIIRDFVWGPITWEIGGEGPGIGAPGS